MQTSEANVPGCSRASPTMFMVRCKVETRLIDCQSVQFCL